MSCGRRAGRLLELADPAGRAGDAGPARPGGIRARRRCRSWRRRRRRSRPGRRCRRCRWSRCRRRSGTGLPRRSVHGAAGDAVAGEARACTRSRSCPALLAQLASAAQPPLFVAHSSTSTHSEPSPLGSVKPGLQGAQEKVRGRCCRWRSGRSRRSGGSRTRRCRCSSCRRPRSRPCTCSCSRRSGCWCRSRWRRSRRCSSCTRRRRGRSSPLPLQPALQAQVRAPVVLVQVACSGSQPPFWILHSSSSAQVTPLPTQPGWAGRRSGRRARSCNGVRVAAAVVRGRTRRRRGRWPYRRSPACRCRRGCPGCWCRSRWGRSRRCRRRTRRRRRR